MRTNRQKQFPSSLTKQNLLIANPASVESRLWNSLWEEIAIPCRFCLQGWGKPVQSRLSEFHYDRRWHTIEAQIPTSDLSVRGP